MAYIRHYEGFKAKAYRCPAGKWTIGYGHLCPEGHPPVTKEQADAYLREDLTVAYNGLKQHAPFMLEDTDIPSHMAVALVSFIFNLGAGNFASSTLLKRLKVRDWKGAHDEFARWVYVTDPKTGNRKPLRGLLLRRYCERLYFMEGRARVF